MKENEPQVSIIMPCYNAAAYLDEAISSVINQSFTNWELVVVDDGSTDASREIAQKYAATEPRIILQHKENGGYVSARLYGLQFICSASEFLLFFDADDILHRQMIEKLYQLMTIKPALGEACCNHVIINSNGEIIGEPAFGIRLQPTLFGVKKISEYDLYTPFISIFCWTGRMIEPMTLIRRKAYEESAGWDIRFGKGRGNIGDGTLLFSEIALSWKAGYLHEPLYYYRKHPGQATADPVLNQLAAEKVLAAWKDRIVPTYKFSKDIKAAVIAYEYRIEVFKKMGSLKYFIRYKPLKAIALLCESFYKYLFSLQLIFYRRTKVFET